MTKKIQNRAIFYICGFVVKICAFYKQSAQIYIFVDYSRCIYFVFKPSMKCSFLDSVLFVIVIFVGNSLFDFVAIAGGSFFYLELE